MAFRKKEATLGKRWFYELEGPQFEIDKVCMYVVLYRSKLIETAGRLLDMLRVDV